MQKVKKYSRQILVLFLALATVLTCVVIMAPKADAAAGQYYIKMTAQDAKHGCENTSGQIKILTKQNNGTSSTDGDTWTVTPAGGDWDNTNLHTYYFNSTTQSANKPINGFPYKLDTSAIRNNNAWYEAKITFVIYVSKDNSDWHEVFRYTEAHDGKVIEKNRYYFTDNKEVSKDNFPYVTNSSLAPTEVLIPTDGSTPEKKEKLTITAYDQYGVEWVNAPTKNAASNTESAPLPTISSQTTKTPDVTFKNHTKDYTTTFKTTWASANTSHSSVEVESNEVNVKVRHSIIPDVNGGNAMNPRYGHTDDKLTLNDATRTAYTFAGWEKTGGEGTVDGKNFTFGNGDTNVKAKWNPIHYSAKFYDRGNLVTDLDYTAEPTPVDIPVPTDPYDGYTFDHWEVLTNDENIPWIYQGTVTSDVFENQNGLRYGNVDIGAVWTPNEYTLKYNLNYNGRQGTPDPMSSMDKSVTYDAELGGLPSPTFSGYNFLGWFTAPVDGTQVDANTKYTKDIFPTDWNEGATIYAHWQPNEYTVTYNTDGGDTLTETKYNIESGTLSTATKTGYTFVHWEVTDVVGASNVQVGDTFNENASLVGKYGNITLKAIWTANTYKLNFDLNDDGGDRVQVDGGAKCDTTPLEVVYDSQINGLPEPKFTAYKFLGWFTEKDGGEQVSDGAIYNVTTLTNWTHEDGATLYAHWQPIEYTATFDPAPGKFVSGDLTKQIKFTIEQGFTFPEANEAERDGYTLSYWKVAERAGNWKEVGAQVLPGSESPSPRYGDVKFEANYGVGDRFFVTYDVNDGEQYTGEGRCDTAGHFFTYDEVMGTLPTPERDGYDFLGWYKEKDREAFTEEDKVDENTTYNWVAGETTLYAQWSPITYTLTFDVDNGEYMEPLEFTIEDEITLQAPTREGYDFLFWVDLEATNGSWPKNATYEPGNFSLGKGHWGDTKFRASYSIKMFNITWIINGEEETVQVKYNEIPSHFAPLVSSAEYNYEFTGWYPEPVAATEDATYTAQFTTTPKSYRLYWLDDSGKVLHDETVQFGTEIDANKYPVPERTGYTVEWECGETTMPARDFTITAKYTPKTFTVKWYDGDKLLETDENVPYDSMPEYNGEPQTKEADDMYTYVWSGNWTPEVAPVDGDISYYADYKKIPKEYQITFYAGDDGKQVVKQYNLGYGLTITDIPEVPDNSAGHHGYWKDLPRTMPAENLDVHAEYLENSYKITWVTDSDAGTTYNTVVRPNETPSFPYGTPEKPTTPEYTYKFKGWSASADGEILDKIPEATSDATYYAIYENTPRIYNVRWIVNGRTVKSENLAYGTLLPEVTIEAKTGHTAEWDYKESTVPARNLVITAVYIPINYTITWVVDGKSVETQCAYGTEPNFTGSTAKPSTDTTDYTFSGWTPEPETVTGEATYTAQYTESVRKYHVIFIADEVRIQEFDVPNGEPIPYVQLPVKTGYTGEWENLPDVMPTSNLVIYGKYTPRKYTITWVTPQGRITTQADYDSMPVFPNATPTRPSTLEKDYTFRGWSPALKTVTGNATYTAQFNESFRKYTATFIADGKVISIQSVAYGDELPSVPIPPKTGYTGKWSTEYRTMPSHDITVEAQYTANKYTVKWYADGKLVHSETLDFNSPIPKIDVPEKPGHIGRWKDTYQRVPANDVDIEAVYTKETYTVSWNIGDDSDSRAIEYGETFEYTFESEELPDGVRVSVKGAPLNDKDFTYSPSTGRIVIPGNLIVGDVHITAKTADGYYNVSIHVDGAGSSNDAEIYEQGMAYHTQILPPEGFLPPESIEVYLEGKLITEGYTYDSDTGKLTINFEIMVGELEIRGVCLADPNYVPPEEQKPDENDGPFAALIRFFERIATFFRRIFGLV